MTMPYREDIDSYAVHDGISYPMDHILQLAENRSVHGIRITRLSWLLDEYPLDMNDENVKKRVELVDVGMPIIVTYSRRIAKFVVLDGRHRLHRAKEMGHEILPCRVIAEHELVANTMYR